MLPGGSAAQAVAHFCGGDDTNFTGDFERVDAVADFSGWFVLAVPGGNQQLELIEHPPEGVRLSVVPGDDALGGVAAANEEELARF